MHWNSKELKTVGDFLAVIKAIAESGKKEEAAAFMEGYRTESPNADNDIGYLTGYLDKDFSRKARELFGVLHPVFGNDDPDGGVQGLWDDVLGRLGK